MRPKPHWPSPSRIHDGGCDPNLPVSGVLLTNLAINLCCVDMIGFRANISIAPDATLLSAHNAGTSEVGAWFLHLSFGDKALAGGVGDRVQNEGRRILLSQASRVLDSSSLA